MKRISHFSFMKPTRFPRRRVNDSDSLLFFPAPPEGLADIAAAHPSLRIAVLGKPAETGANVYSIRYDPTFETYLAGFAVGLTARDWRGEALLPSDDPFLGERSAETSSANSCMTNKICSFTYFAA